VKDTSFLKVFVIFFVIFVNDLLTFHICVGINKITRIKINQEEEKIEELGSKTENKFFIILKIYSFFEKISLLLSLF